jgi:hypothetical protein
MAKDEVLDMAYPMEWPRIACIPCAGMETNVADSYSDHFGMELS